MRRGIVILGMHRSGTSLIAETISRWGATVPNEYLARGTRWNPRGYWEYRPLVKLNRALLAALSSSWCLPPPDGAGACRLADNEQYHAAAMRVLASVQNQTVPWFWKDPRLCLLLPFWQRLWGEPAYVICWREPEDIAASLLARNRFPRELGILLWQRYVSMALRGVPESSRRLVVSYRNMLTQPLLECQRLAEFLDGEGGTPPGEAAGLPRAAYMAAAVDGGLNHGQDDGERVRCPSLTIAQHRLCNYMSELAGAAPGEAWESLPDIAPAAGWREQIAGYSHLFDDVVL